MGPAQRRRRGERGGVASGGAERGGREGGERAGGGAQAVTRRLSAPGWLPTTRSGSWVPCICVAGCPQTPWDPGPTVLIWSLPRAPELPPRWPTPPGPGGVGEGHSGTLPGSAPPLRSCTCHPLGAPLFCGGSSDPALSFQASPPAAAAPDCPTVLLAGGLNHFKQDNCQTHSRRQPGPGTWKVQEAD